MAMKVSKKKNRKENVNVNSRTPARILQQQTVGAGDQAVLGTNFGLLIAPFFSRLSSDLLCASFDLSLILHVDWFQEAQTKLMEAVIAKNGNNPLSQAQMKYSQV